MLLEPARGRGLDRDVPLRARHPVLIERDLDPGIERDLGRAGLGQRAHDPERLLRLERPRVEDLAAGAAQGEPVDRTGRERLGRDEERGPIAGLLRDRERERRLDGEAGGERRGRSAVAALEPESGVDGDDRADRAAQP